MLTDAQREVLLRPIMPQRVAKDGKGFSHVEAFEITAHLTRMFGFEGWDKEILELNRLLGSAIDGKFSVTYFCRMRLTLRDPEGQVIKVIDDASTGSATNQRNEADAHDLALKSAISGALKRCAKDLGDGFGLSLYDHGSTDALVRKVVPYEGTDKENDA